VNLGRLYFAFQGVAGGLWWWVVFLSPSVRQATLGSLPPVPVALFDIPLFVIGSFLAALGLRTAVWAVFGWTFLVTGVLGAYVTATQEAAWGALLMLAACAGTLVATSLAVLGRVPTEWVILGPFTFRTTTDTLRRQHLARTLRQLVAFWVFFLAVLPALVMALERRWGLEVLFPSALRMSGVVVFLLASALGLWSAYVMATVGEGTPLPSMMARRLVIVGPYRYVRNPMAVAGIGQGIAVGLMAGSWLVIVYGLVGSMIWNWVVRPHEEADLTARFGDEFREYQQTVSCWVPKRR
jgi:protein-S-isoprenylcysteine O-methyltransferase Ste14